jgi:methylmalonyl-CoA/ethylmalonyl-CoA epimerase
VTSLCFHHVGYVVASIEESLPRFVATLCPPWVSAVIEDPIQRVKVLFLGAGPDGPVIELVEPVGPQSPVTRVLAAGGGLHHVCYQADDLEQEIARTKGAGAVLIRKPQPATAFGGRRICWLMTADRLLLELLERRPPAEASTT